MRQSLGWTQLGMNTVWEVNRGNLVRLALGVDFRCCYIWRRKSATWSLPWVVLTTRT